MIRTSIRKRRYQILKIIGTKNQINKYVYIKKWNNCIQVNNFFDML